MTILNILTWLLIVVAWAFIIRGNRHMKVAAYFKGRADECEMQIVLHSFPPEMAQEIHRMMLRNQMGEYLGEKEADYYDSIYNDIEPLT